MTRPIDKNWHVSLSIWVNGQFDAGKNSVGVLKLIIISVVMVCFNNYSYISPVVFSPLVLLIDVSISRRDHSYINTLLSVN